MLLNYPAGKTVAKCQMITIQLNVHNVSTYLTSLKTVRVETLRCTINFSVLMGKRTLDPKKIFFLAAKISFQSFLRNNCKLPCN